MCNNDCNNCPRQVCDCRPGILKENNKYKQALDEIRQYRVCEINDVDGEEGDVILEIIDEVME